MDSWSKVVAALHGQAPPTPASWPFEQSRRFSLSDAELNLDSEQLPRLRRMASDRELLALIAHLGSVTTAELSVVLRLRRSQVHERLYPLIQDGRLEAHRGGWRVAGTSERPVNVGNPIRQTKKGLL